MGEEVVSQLKVTVSPVPTVSWDGVIVGFCGGSDERRRIYIYYLLQSQQICCLQACMCGPFSLENVQAGVVKRLI